MSETTKTADPRRKWTAPELKKLGTIADVAGGQTAGTQAMGSKS